MLSGRTWRAILAVGLVLLCIFGLLSASYAAPAAQTIVQASATFTPTTTLTPTNTPPPPIPEGALSGTVIRATVLIVRQGPFLGAPEVGRVRRGERYQVVGRNPNADWYLIQLYGTQGWVWSYYFAVDGNEFSAPEQNPFTTIPNESSGTGVVAQATDGLRLRAEPDVASPQIGRVTWGSYLPVIGRSTRGEWYQVVYLDTVGWVFAPNTRIIQGDIETIPFIDAPDVQPVVVPPYNVDLPPTIVVAPVATFVPPGGGNFAVVSTPAG